MPSAARIQRSCPRCKTTFDSEALFCPNDGVALDPPGDAVPNADPYIGAVIHDDVVIRSVAGAGAMGRVYRAHQRGTDRDVAVKILHRELSGNVGLVQRFHREAKIASKLQHPHVVDVYLAGQLPDGALYIVMEYLDGMSLAARGAAEGGVLSLERALPITLQICDAVGEGHTRGIVHRDLKPENVMLVRRAETSDWVKVLDFGIAKVNLGEQSMETAAGLIFGTARYISPEGAQGTAVGPTGDVYSIAVILYQLLAGRSPFDSAQPVGMLIKHIHEAPPPLRSWPAAANVPEPIARVVMDNLAKDPSLRQPNARALGNAIANAAKEANVSISEVGVVARMSVVDLVAPRPASESVADAANGSAPAEPLVAAAPASLTPIVAPQRTADPPAIASASSPDSSAHPAPAPVQTTAKKYATFIGLLTFLLGVTVTASVMQYMAQRPDVERTAHVQRARLALVKGHYVEPPGDNVREIVKAGLVKWPEDSSLAKIQSDAAHEVVTRAMAARSGGDVVGARDLARTAHDLDPTDGTAKLLLSQYEGELAASSEDVDGGIVGLRVALDIPIGHVRRGGRAELVARVVMGSGDHEIKGAQFVVTGPGLAPSGVVLAATGTGPYRAAFSPPREGDYEVEFEANVEGTAVRADRTLFVSR